MKSKLKYPLAALLLAVAALEGCDLPDNGSLADPVDQETLDNEEALHVNSSGYHILRLEDLPDWLMTCRAELEFVRLSKTPPPPPWKNACIDLRPSQAEWEAKHGAWAPDDSPSFRAEWLMKHATPEMLEDWENEIK